MNRKYNLRLDLQFRCNSSIMKFDEFDNNTSDFFIRVTRAGELIDISKAIVTLVVIKPDNSVDAQFVDIDSNRAYCNLKPTMKNIPGKYEAIASITVDGETVNTDIDNPIIYEVTKNKFLRQLNEEVKSDERFTILTEMINRLSSIETNENTRIENENNRVESEKLREQDIEKIKNDIEELISQTNKKVEDNLKTNTSKIDTLVTNTKKELNEYKESKNTELEENLSQYKLDTTKDIKEYKNLKNDEIDKAIKSIPPKEELVGPQGPKGDTGATGPQGIQGPKGDTGAQGPIGPTPSITHLENQVNEKMKEVDSAEQQRVTDHQSREEFLNSFESQLDQIENKNTEQDNRLKNVEYKNKVQDVYISGLFNENKDGRLSIEGEGNSLKLEGSKEGLCTVGKVVGDTRVNVLTGIHYLDNAIYDENNKTYTFNKADESMSSKVTFKPSIPLDATKTYTLIFNILENTLVRSDSFERVGKFNLTSYNSGLKMILQNELGFVSVALQQPNDGLVKTPYLETFGSGILKITKPVLFEGDYTNKPIPSEYFEGMQSTFEDKLITDESDANFGKYEAEVMVRGKNLLNTSNMTSVEGNFTFKNGVLITSKHGSWGLDIGTKFRIPVYLESGKSYALSVTVDSNYGNYATALWDANGNKVVDWFGAATKTVATSGLYYISLGSSINGVETRVSNIQLEEGTTATAYEPYFSRTQTVYLNSPILKGDEIVCKEDGLYHYHVRGSKKLISNVYSKAGSNGTRVRFVCADDNIIKDIAKGDCICDKLPYKEYITVDGTSNCISTSTYLNYIYISLDTGTEDANEQSAYINSWVEKNQPILIYNLAEPYLEKISDDKLILEIPNNATLTFDSIVPVANTKATYTGGIPSVYGLEETGITNTNDIAVTQTAVDFLLMSSMGEVMMMSFKNNTKGGNNMGAYFASRIMKKALKYEDVIRKYPEFKEDIDFILRSEGYGDLIVEVQ